MELETVMVVDDVDLVAKSIRRMLAPVRVVGTTRGRDALDLARTERPQLALVDLYMPDRFGLDVVAELRRELPTLTIGIISGMLNVPLAMECVRASASWFIEKPFNREQLLEAIVRGGAPFTVPRRDTDPPHLFPHDGDDLSLDAMKRQHVRQVFDATGGDYAEAAGKLRIAQSTLRRILARDRRTTD